jgi:hypothetical protein
VVADASPDARRDPTLCPEPAPGEDDGICHGLETGTRGTSYYDAKLRRAIAFSDELERYIRAWAAGTAPARMPESLFPPGFAADALQYELVEPDAIRAEEQWGYRPTHDIDFDALYALGSDNHCTYFVLPFVAPFGSRLVIEGDFPHARFMSFQVTPPYDPRYPHTSSLGAAEIALLDADIEPDPGNVNPFRVGADRNASERHYHVAFEMAHGNHTALNPLAHRPPFRAACNTRVGGPFGDSGDLTLALHPEWEPGIVWMRYYGPDSDAGPLGGVPFPKAHIELPTGERYWVRGRFLEAYSYLNNTAPGRITPPEPAPPSFYRPRGWSKDFGLALSIAGVPVEIWNGGTYPSWARALLRDTDRSTFNRGPDRCPPGNLQASSSLVNYTNYLAHADALGPQEVIVMTGKLPVAPRTRGGEPRMTGGDVRYFSFCHVGDLLGQLYGCLMDDEIVTDAEGQYVIAYSRGADRPSNAVESAGVTWQEWGPLSYQAIMLRWMDIAGEWAMPADENHAPDEVNVPWELGAPSQETYDRSLIGENRPNVMGPYHPVFHYLTRDQFEALGSPVDPSRIP